MSQRKRGLMGFNAPRKRQRTLNAKVASLSRQVAANKKELKYYDGTLTVSQSTPAYQSIFTQAANVPPFLGRGLRVHKVEVSHDNSIKFSAYTERKPRSTLVNPLASLSHRYDPESYT